VQGKQMADKSRNNSALNEFCGVLPINAISLQDFTFGLHCL